MKRVIFLLVTLLAACRAGAVEVHFYPSDKVFLNKANAEGNYDLLAHGFLISNPSTERVTVEAVKFQLYAENRLMQEVHVDPARLAEASKELLSMQADGLQVLVDIMLPPAALGKRKLVSSTELNPGEALAGRNVFIAVQGVPTRLKLEATVIENNRTTQAVTEVPVIEYKSLNQYQYPLQGVWYMQSVPNVTSHHRWLPQTEFGIDFLKLDAGGSFFKTDGKKAEDYYAFGEPVLAAADGTVVKVINDAVQNWDAWLQRPDETKDDFYKRSSTYQFEQMKKDLYRAVTGNLVVIEHAGGEYSAYAHLKTGSVRVKEGDRIQKGVQIASVGDTGDYYMAHLHFQISNSPDVLHARSLPFEFVNLGKRPELGHFANLKK